MQNTSNVQWSSEITSNWWGLSSITPYVQTFGAIIVVVLLVVVIGGIAMSLMHASKDRSTARTLQSVLFHTKAHQEVLRGFKEAGIDPATAVTPTPMPMMTSPVAAKSAKSTMNTVLLTVIAIAMVVIAAKLLF